MAEVRICVLAAGAPLHGNNLVTNINNYSKKMKAYFHDLDKKWGYALIDPSKFDILLNLGFFMTAGNLFRDIKLLHPEKQIVNWWIGTDILNAYEHVQRGHNDVMDSCRKYADIQLADAPNFKEEVKVLFDLDSTFIPTVPPIPMKPLEIVNDKTIGFYVSEVKPEWYQVSVVEKVASMMPEYTFLFFGRGMDKKPTSPNVIHLGFVEGEAKVESMKNCKAHIRIAVHDGVSIMLIEFAQMGRRIITNRDLPFTRRVTVTPENLKTAIEEECAKEGLDTEASEFYTKTYSPANQISALEAVLNV